MKLEDFAKNQLQTTLSGEIALSGGLSEFGRITPKTALSDINLNWSESELPERLRTKHVHRLHPYLGKFIPQLAEVFLRKFTPKRVCDPFCGSGTTLVEANTLNVASVGIDVSEFNCLLSRVKTAEYDIHKTERELKDAFARTNALVKITNRKMITDNEYLNKWFHPKALNELLIYRSLIKDYEYADLMKIVLSRSARSARLTTHFDLDFPKKPQTKPYNCYKHGKICKPTDDALGFLSRYTVDAIKRIKEFSKVRTNAEVKVICGDSRKVDIPEVDAIITSPPYVGLIDYHEQHRYAYELLGLPLNGKFEIGSSKNGSSKKAKREYSTAICDVFKNVKKSLSDGGVAVVVVNDKDGVYGEIAEKAGYASEDKLQRNVGRRTGRRAGEFYEDILIWRSEA